MTHLLEFKPYSMRSYTVRARPTWITYVKRMWIFCRNLKLILFFARKSIHGLQKEKYNYCFFAHVWNLASNGPRKSQLRILGLRLKGPTKINNIANIQFRPFNNKKNTFKHYVFVNVVRKKNSCRLSSSSQNNSIMY